MTGNVANDFRVALRSVVRSPGYAFTAVLTLAVGMTAATLVFSVINAILLRSLPVQRPSEILAISTVGEMSFLQQEPIAFADFQQIGRDVAAMSSVVAHRRVPSVLGSGTDSRVALGERVTANYFPMLGLGFAVGRGFSGSQTKVLLNAGAIGALATSLFAARAITILPTGASPQDPATLISGIVVLLTTAVVAGAWPAWRASRVDPMTALRTE